MQYSVNLVAAGKFKGRYICTHSLSAAYVKVHRLIEVNLKAYIKTQNHKDKALISVKLFISLEPAYQTYAGILVLNKSNKS